MLQEHWARMLREVEALFPEEACGFLAGIGSEVMQVVAVTNILHSRTRYRMDPREQLEAMQHIEGEGRSVIGIYHSHMAGPTELSLIDIEEAAYLDAAYLVWSRPQSTWQCRAFRIVDRQPFEVDVLVMDKAT